MNKLQRLAPWCWLSILLCQLAYTVWQLPQRHWSSSITDLLPMASQPWQQELLSNINSSKQVTLKLSGLPLPQLRAAADKLLQQPPAALTWYQPGVMLTQLQQQYQQHQSLLLSPQSIKLLQQQQYQSLVAAAQQRLYSPAPLLADAMLQDPLLLTQQFVEQQGQQALALKQHWFETPSGDAIILFGEIQLDPFDRRPASQLLQTLEQQFSVLTESWPELELARSGVLFHAVHAAKNASFEMQFYGGLSLLAVLLLLWGAFRSVKPLWLATLVLIPAVLSGLAALLFTFSSPHVLAMVFATTLIGIAVDYSFHGMLAANKGKAAFNAMLPSLLLSLLTTVLGYLALLLLPFALLQQVALFMLAGLLAAFLSVWLLLPLCLTEQTMQQQLRLVAGCQRLNQGYQKMPRQQFWRMTIGGSAALALFLLLQGRFSDDVRLFNQSPASLLQQEAAVRAANAQQWDSRLLVVLADDAEHALQKEYALQQHLLHWQQQNWLLRWQGLTQQLPPQQQQAQSQQLLQQAYQHNTVQSYLAQLQLPVPAVRNDWLTPDTFSSPLTKQLIKLQQHTAAVILLQQLAEPELLRHALQSIPDVYLLDPIADTNNSLRQLRHQLLWWLGLAFALSIAVLVWQRGITIALAAGLILALATGAALTISQLLQQQLNVFNLVAAILVLALALDYAVFFTSTLPKPDVFQAVLLSASTSCLAFGMLSFSQTPAVASFGLTVFSGVALAALLAPLLTVVSTKETE